MLINTLFKKLALGFMTLAMFSMMLMTVGCSQDKSVTAPKNVYEGVLVIESVIPDSIYQEMMRGGFTEDMLSKGNSNDFLYGKVILKTTDSGVLITRPLNDVEVRIAGKIVRTDLDGKFNFEKIELDNNQVEIYSDSGFLFSVSYMIEKENQIMIKIINQIEKHMGHGAAEAATGCYIPCLDNNGVGSYNFINSDCYMSLFRYGFFPCWAEAMQSVHDHRGWRWCNCWSNCSLITHYWNYNKQFWHTHGWWPWI